MAPKISTPKWKLPTLEYNVTRPWPFPWFTPVAIIGAIILTALFSTLNYALNGFDMVSYEFTEPQTQTSNTAWYQSFSALQTNSMAANCSPVTFPVESNFFTNQSGLTYTLSAIWSSESNGIKNYEPALSYLNEPFRNCSIFLLQVEIEELDRTSTQVDIASWGSAVRAYATCQLATSMGGSTHVNLTTSYEAISSTFSQKIGPQRFVAAHPKTKASLWWGESILNARWANLSSTLALTWPYPYTDPPRKWLTQLVRTDGIHSIMNGNFFGLNYNLIYDLSVSSGVYGNYTNVILTDINDPVGAADAISGIGQGDDAVSNGTNILSSIDRLAKSMYSAVMVDLGQTGQPERSNILLDPSILQSFTSELSFNTSYAFANFITGPATADYDTLKSTTGNLTVTPSVIATRYTCQIPKRKPMGSLILSILVADLVFLQASWAMYNFVAGFFLKNKHHRNYCEGCVKHLTSNAGPQTDEMDSPLVPLRRPPSSRAISVSSQTMFLGDPHQYHSVSVSSPLD